MRLRKFSKKLRQGRKDVAFVDSIEENVLPAVDDTYNLGSSTAEFKDLYVDGIAYIDQVRGEAALCVPVRVTAVVQTGSMWVSGNGSYWFVRIAGAWKSGALH